jgi:hypothetical protein
MRGVGWKGIEDEEGGEMRQTQIDHGRNFIKLKSFIHFGS